MSPLAVLIIIVVVTLIVFGSIHSHKKKLARQAAFTQIASNRGWHYTTESRYDLDSQFPQFSCFNTGSSRYAYNILSGTLPIDEEHWPMLGGDYHYTTTSGSGKDRKTHHHHFSFLVVQLPYRDLPSLSIRQEGFFDRIASFIGFDDIDFESAEFSQRFHVKGSDKKFVYDIIHPRMMEFLMAHETPPLEIENSVCCLSNGSRIWQPQEFIEHAEYVAKFFSHWPQHVTTTLLR